MSPANDRSWALAAAAITLTALGLVVADVWRWHPGFAIGDESDIVSFLQRYREGMPWPWVPFNGSLHKMGLQACMGLWPGALWTSSLPNILALALEAALLFAVAKSLAGPRAAFFAVLFATLSAFTLLRARVGLSFGLFPAEWLLLVWLRGKATPPWARMLWGAALGLCLFDYEGWSAAAFLLLALPIGRDLSWRALGWELLGIVAVLAALAPWTPLAEHFLRRRTASVWYAPSGASYGQGLLGLLLGGASLPYMAPSGIGVCAPWLAALAGLGLWSWGRRALPWVVFIAVGTAMPLMGGAPYGLPAHRFILAWPALMLGAGVGADLLLRSWPGGRSVALLTLLLSLGLGQQLIAWQRSQTGMDALYRGPVRDMKRAADAAWADHLRLGWPLVTELHPVKGSLFRYFVGHALPVPGADATQVVATLSSEYAPAFRVRGLDPAFVRSFQETSGSSPALVAELHGRLAGEAVGVERAMRPLLASAPQGSLANAAAAKAWLAGNPKAGPWARTVALDSASLAAWYHLRFDAQDFAAITAEPLVSVRPLLLMAPTMTERDPQAAAQLLQRARGIDPYNARVRQLEVGALRRLGRAKEAQALESASAAMDAQGQLIWE